MEWIRLDDDEEWTIAVKDDGDGPGSPGGMLGMNDGMGGTIGGGGDFRSAHGRVWNLEGACVRLITHG
jgi:hypothetical protein